MKLRRTMIDSGIKRTIVTLRIVKIDLKCLRIKTGYLVTFESNAPK